MTITVQSLLEYGLDAVLELFNRGFADYFVPIQLPMAGLLGMLRQDSVDPALSRVVFSDGQAAGVALIARRGWTSRLAAMAIVPEARGRGVGEVCVRHLLDEARERGDRAMTLEVIEQNTPAVNLYRKCGFQTDRRLLGYAGQPLADAGGMDLEVADIRAVAGLLGAHSAPDLPWQLSAETLAQAGPPSVAYRRDAAYLVISNPDAPTIVIRALVTLPHARRQGQAVSLLRAAAALHPGKTWRAAAIWPEAFGAIFEQFGLQRENLSQLQMSLTIS